MGRGGWFVGAQVRVAFPKSRRLFRLLPALYGAHYTLSNPGYTTRSTPTLERLETDALFFYRARGIRVRPGAPLFSSGGGTDTKGGDETETKGTGLSDTNKDEKDTKDNYSSDKHKDTKNTRENTLSDKHKGNAEKDTKGKDLGNTLGDTREGGTVRRNHGACFETSSSENRRDNTKGALRTVASLGLRRTVLSAKMLRKNHPQLLKLLVGQVLSTITNGTMLSSYTLYAQRELGATGTVLRVSQIQAPAFADCPPVITQSHGPKD